MVAVAGHFGFLVYLVVGGFLAGRWPRTLALHLAVVSWGVGSVVFGFPCPLTALERWGRAGAGMAPLPPEGFIAHYLTGVVYPADAVGLVQAAVFVAIALSWAMVWRARRGEQTGPDGGRG
jgi:hypothetical protein